MAKVGLRNTTARSYYVHGVKGLISLPPTGKHGVVLVDEDDAEAVLKSKTGVYLSENGWLVLVKQPKDHEDNVSPEPKVVEKSVAAKKAQEEAKKAS